MPCFFKTIIYDYFYQYITATKAHASVIYKHLFLCKSCPFISHKREDNFSQRFYLNKKLQTNTYNSTLPTSIDYSSLLHAGIAVSYNSN